MAAPRAHPEHAGAAPAASSGFLKVTGLSTHAGPARGGTRLRISGTGLKGANVVVKFARRSGFRMRSGGVASMVEVRLCLP